MTSAIRAKAMCVFRHGDRILVEAEYDPGTDEAFFVPPGGGIEFGERAVDAIRREMREELRADICDVRLLGVLENLFTFESRQGHEIVFVFEARFTDAALYERDEITGTEGSHPFVARWMPLASFAPGGPPLYPEGLRDLFLDNRH